MERKEDDSQPALTDEDNMRKRSSNEDMARAACVPTYPYLVERDSATRPNIIINVASLVAVLLL